MAVFLVCMGKAGFFTIGSKVNRSWAGSSEALDGETLKTKVCTHAKAKNIEWLANDC
ncbi:MAG: hypothetical protein ACWA6U_11485 [Breznakibacter sp.]